MVETNEKSTTVQVGPQVSTFHAHLSAHILFSPGSLVPERDLSTLAASCAAFSAQVK